MRDCVRVGAAYVVHSFNWNHMTSEPELLDANRKFVLGLWGVRYQVKDVARAVAFYTERLGFNLDQKNPPAFAQVSIGHLKLFLAVPAPQGPVRCPMVAHKSPVDGTE